MGPKSKKAPKNAFSFFLDEYVESERKNGRNVSHRIAAEECSPLWKSLPEEERQRYGKMAASHKEYTKNDKRNKFTSTGVSFAELERQQEELKLKTEKAENEMKATISSLDSDSLKEHLFYMIHCNYYCKTDAGVYVPGEIALVEFNLRDGIRRVFHTLINPGKIPPGYAYEAKQTIDSIHDLPYPPYEEGESDYFGILDKILTFLKPGKLPNGLYPPLYCIENNIKASENILQTLSDNTTENKNYFRVYYLHKMFFLLKNKCVQSFDEENVGFPVLSSADTEIKKDVFCYVPGISCAFHATSEDKYHNCSLSVVQRFVFTICDHCCQYLKIDLVPGKHCRVKADTTRNITRAKIEQASQRSRFSPPPSEFTESDFDGRSSYCGDMSVRDWKRDHEECFLHDELHSKFEPVETASVRSKSFSAISKKSSTPKFCPDSSDDDDNVSKFSIGRGFSCR